MLRQKLGTASPPQLPLPPVREVDMEVVFGTPSKNCSGNGICMLASRLPRYYLIPCPHAPVTIHYMGGQELVFRFRKKYLCDRAVQTYFSSPRFLVEEAVALPQRLIRLWNLTIDRIPPGQYALEEYSREWRLYIPLYLP